MRTAKILLVSLLGSGALFAAGAPELAIVSAAFGNGGAIPAEYTCEGRNVPPPLRWSGVSPKARSLVLIVDDPDAPDPRAPKMTWVHWVLYNLPPKADGLEGEKLPAGTKTGRNSWRRAAWGGPCPPIGRHRYFFKLYALDTRLRFDGVPDKNAVLDAMRGHVLQKAELVGTYEKRTAR